DELTDVACPPEPGDRWRINFSRVQWRLDARPGGYDKTIDPSTGKSFAEQNWVWTPQRAIAMHEPEYWGFVEFRTLDDMDRSVEVQPDDQARMALRLFSDVARKSDVESAKRMGRPAMLPSAWTWPPDVSSGKGWFNATIRTSAGRSLRIDHAGALSDRDVGQAR
ncbi:MAG: hypothetical protein AAF432_15595, partial [Planctomycetota bacterium]